MYDTCFPLAVHNRGWIMNSVDEMGPKQLDHE